MARNNRILVPEARQEMNQLKQKVQARQSIPTGQTRSGYQGNLTAKEAGSLGGPTGGQMVHELIQIAEQSLNHQPTKSFFIL